MNKVKLASYVVKKIERVEVEEKKIYEVGRWLYVARDTQRIRKQAQYHLEKFQPKEQ